MYIKTFVVLFLLSSIGMLAQGTPAITCSAGQFINSQYANTGQACGTPAVPSPATVAPLIDGTATVGTSTLYARQDHVHPTDTSRASVASVTAIAPIAAVTPSIGGSSIVVGCTNFATVTVTGATTAMSCVMSGAGSQPANTSPQCFVSAANTVTPQLCTAIALGITPAATVYNLRVVP